MPNLIKTEADILQTSLNDTKIFSIAIELSTFRPFLPDFSSSLLVPSCHRISKQSDPLNDNYFIFIHYFSRKEITERQFHSSFDGGFV
jgi:hypothetical protein